MTKRKASKHKGRPKGVKNRPKVTTKKLRKKLIAALKLVKSYRL